MSISQPHPFSQCLKPASISVIVIWNTGCSMITECWHTPKRGGKDEANRPWLGMGTVCRAKRLWKDLWSMFADEAWLWEAWCLTWDSHFSNTPPSLFIGNTQLGWPIHLSVSRDLLAAIPTVPCPSILMPHLTTWLPIKHWDLYFWHTEME